MSQIFIAFSGGALVVTEQIAALAASDHQHVAVILAVEGLFTQIGGAIGGSISSAIWTSVFGPRLYKYMPVEEYAKIPKIYSNLYEQRKYPEGSPARIAIEMAYGDAQRYMCIAASCILALMFPCIMAWRDIRVKEFKQVKGLVV